MKRLYRLLPLLIALWGASLTLTMPGLAVDQAPVIPPHEAPVVDITFGQIMAVIMNFGIGGLVFFVWYMGLKRQTGLHTLIEQYSYSAQAHLAAFKDINERNTAAFRELMEAFREQSKESRDAILMSVQAMSEVKEQIREIRHQMERKP